MRNTNLTDLFDKIRATDEYARTIEKGRDMYESKPFIIQNRGLYRMTIVNRWVMGAVSVCSGMASSLTFDLPLFITIPLSIIILSFVELLKNVTVNDVCRVWFTRKKISPSLPIALFLFGASVFLSVRGAMEAGDLLRQDGAEAVASSYAHKVDSLSALFDAKKEEAQGIAQQFREDNLVVVSRGKRALRFNATNKYNELVSAVGEVERKKEEALAQLRKEEDEASNKQGSKAENNTLLLAFICGSVELSILGLIAFGAFYLYRAYEEPELAESATSYSLQLSELGKLVELSRMAGAQEGFASPYASFKDPSKQLQSNIAEKASIGFKSPSKNLASMPAYVEAQHQSRAMKHSDYFEKYPELINDLQAVNAGEMKATVKELAEHHNVHEATIYRVKKAIFV